MSGSRASWPESRPLAREVVVLDYAERELDGQGPPAPIPAAMAAVNAVLAVTLKSITHTAARRAASAAGVRVATMPGINEECLIRTMNADYRSTAARTERVTERLSRARTAHSTTRSEPTSFCRSPGSRPPPLRDRTSNPVSGETCPPSMRTSVRAFAIGCACP
jgi:hypothetical protein